VSREMINEGAVKDYAVKLKLMEEALERRYFRT
jgi:hypothetical protein